MKKSFLLLFLFAYATVVFSQSFKSIGIKSGLTLSKQIWNYVTIDNKIIKDNKQGFCLYLSSEFIDNKYFSLLVDAGFAQKGTSEPSPLTFSSTFNYVTVSPLIKMRWERMSLIPYAIAGPRFDILMNYVSDIDLSSLEANMNKITLGLVYGGGLEFRNKHIGFMAEAQQQIDATKFINQPTTNNTSELNVRNQALIIQAGIRYYFRPY
jgi:hypothetical protein